MAGTSYLAAAVAVLGDAVRPMTDHEITDEALRRGLINPGSGRGVDRDFERLHRAVRIERPRGFHAPARLHVRRGRLPDRHVYGYRMRRKVTERPES